MTTKKKTTALKKPEKAAAKPKAPKKATAAEVVVAAPQPVEVEAAEHDELGDVDEIGGGRDRSAVTEIVETILAADDRARLVIEQADRMQDERATAATKAARILDEMVAHTPQAVVPVIDRFVLGLTSPHKRVVQTSADALPQLAKLAPARVAKHLDKLKRAFDAATEPGQDGIVRTFAALCVASVAYQKRLEPVLTHALSGADGKVLVRWVEIVLPALKGEPHARARSVVEDRLYSIPRAVAQQVADFLGVRLRTSYRG